MNAETDPDAGPDAGPDVRHLRVLLAVAATGSLTGAAATLGMGQPGVSRALAQLEERVGVRLVRRTTRAVALTPAGEAFREPAARALAALGEAVAAARGRTGPLRLGFSWSAAGRHTVPMLHAWRERHPDRPVLLHRYDDRTAGLATGEVDLALVRLRLDPARYAGTPLFREGRCVAVADDDPLAARPGLALADLAGRPLAVVSAYGTTTLSLWPPDRRPVVAVDARNIDDWLAVIAAGEAVGVTAGSTAHAHPVPGVTYVPLVDAPPVEVRLAWRREAVHPWRREFVDLAREVCGAGRGSPSAVRGEQALDAHHDRDQPEHREQQRRTGQR